MVLQPQAVRAYRPSGSSKLDREGGPGVPNSDSAKLTLQSIQKEQS